MIFESAIYLDCALQSLKPNSQFTFNDADYSTIKWIVLEGEAPSAEEIAIEIERIKEAEKISVTEKLIARQALLAKLGITEEEAKLLLS